MVQPYNSVAQAINIKAPENRGRNYSQAKELTQQNESLNLAQPPRELSQKSEVAQRSTFKQFHSKIPLRDLRDET